MTIDEFIKFWDKSNFEPGTKILKDDYKFLENHLVENCHNFNDYVKRLLNNYGKMQ